MTILIVEDEPLAAKNLVRQIQAYDESYDILPVADLVSRLEAEYGEALTRLAAGAGR